MDLSSDCFVNTLAFLTNIAKGNLGFASLSSDVYGLSTGMGLTLSPMGNYQVFF